MQFIEVKNVDGEPMTLRVRSIDVVLPRAKSKGGGVVVHAGKYEYHIKTDYDDFKQRLLKAKEPVSIVTELAREEI